MSAAIPLIDISPLFGPPSPTRDAADQAIFAAASSSGFMTIRGLDGHVPVGKAARAAILRLFDLPEAEKRKLWRQKFDPANTNVYHGFFPLQNGLATYKEGIDMGPDLAGRPAEIGGDPLLEPTPLPPEAALPGWRAAAAAYYRGMEKLGQAVLHALARGLKLPETSFDRAFAGGISTLRMIHYPPRTPESLAGADMSKVYVEHKGERRVMAGGAHVDSGFVTLLAADGVEGLQARAADGAWIDVPPTEGTLAVNFGALLERWTGGRIKATEHRVVSPERERYSIPFFYEPAVDAVIAPLPIEGAETFAPFTYGDHLWRSMMVFPEFMGLDHLRPPRGLPRAA